MSPFALLFLAIQQRIDTIQDTSNKPIFGTNDQDLMQLEDASRGMNRPPVSWPCALIDIDDSNYSELGDNAQSAIVNVCIRIGFPPFSSTDVKTPAKYRNKALYYYDLEQAVIQAFHGWNPTTVTITPADPDADPVVEAVTADLSDIFGHFIRTRVVKEDRNDFLRVRCIMFTIGMNDYSTSGTTTLTPVTFNLTDQISL